MKAVAIDLGSNTFQVLFVHFNPYPFQIQKVKLETYPYLLKRKIEDGTLKPADLGAFLETLRHRALKYKPDCFKAVATAVWRQYPELESVLTQTIPEARIISGREEAALTLKAIKHLIKPDNFSAIDLGGGSIEIINSHHDSEELSSINAGTAELLRVFPYGKYYNFQQMLNDIVSFLEDLYPAKNLQKHIIGVGGAFHSIANIVLVNAGLTKNPVFSDFSPFPLKQDVPIPLIKDYISSWLKRKPVEIMEDSFHSQIVPSFRLWQLPYIFAVVMWLLKDDRETFASSNAEIKFGLILNCVTSH